MASGFLGFCGNCGCSIPRVVRVWSNLGMWELEREDPKDPSHPNHSRIPGILGSTSHPGVGILLGIEKFPTFPVLGFSLSLSFCRQGRSLFPNFRIRREAGQDHSQIFPFPPSLFLVEFLPCLEKTENSHGVPWLGSAGAIPGFPKFPKEEIFPNARVEIRRKIVGISRMRLACSRKFPLKRRSILESGRTLGILIRYPWKNPW